MDKWPERPNGEVPCLPKKSLLCRNWKNISSQDWNDIQNSESFPVKQNPEVSRNSEFSNQDLNYGSLKNDENNSQLSQAFSPSQNDDYEMNNQFLTQIDWTHTGLSPLNLYTSNDNSSENSNSVANSLSQVSGIPSTYYPNSEFDGVTQQSQLLSNKNLNNTWLFNPNSDGNDKYCSSDLKYTWDKSIKNESNVESSGDCSTLPLPTHPKSARVDERFDENEFLKNNMASRPSVFQTKYGLGNLSMLSLDGMNKKGETIHYEDFTDKKDEKFTVITNFPLKKMDVNSQIESEKWSVEQSPHLSSSTEVYATNEKNLSPNSSLSKHNLDTNSSKRISKTSNYNKTVYRKPSENEGMSVNDITSTTGSQDFKMTGKDKKWPINHKECQVCGDRSAGFYCNAFICEACKKFFVRACKQEKLKYVCLRDKNCSITKESRVQCQFCRYQKCLQLKMHCPASGSMKKEDKTVSDIPCRVCGAPSSGFHFGALTCEGCKGFFRRMAKERESNKYHCTKGGFCEINSLTRNICKACRYKKCLEADMSIEASRIGRQPNAVKHAISLELQNRTGLGLKQGMDITNSSDQDMDIVTEIKQEPISNENSIDCIEFENSFTGTGNPIVSLNGIPKVENRNEKEREKLMSENTENLKGIYLCDSGNSATNVRDSAVGCSETDESWMEIITKIEKANKELLPMYRQEPPSYDAKNFENERACWKYMMKEFDHNAYCVIRFAKKVLGFKTLTMDDQVKLIQGSIYPIVVLNFSRHFDSSTKAFKYFNFGPVGMENIFKHFPMLKILATHFMHAGEMTHGLEMDELEYCFLSTLLLYNGDVPDLNESQKVAELQEEIGYAIQMYEEKKYHNGQTRYGLILLRLAELHLFTVQHDLAIQALIMTNPTVEVPQLYQEIILKWNQ